MENIQDWVQLVIKEEVSVREITNALETEKIEAQSILEILFLDYLKIKKRELNLETIRYADKKTEIARVIEECTEYLKAMQELARNKEISIGDKLSMLIEKTVESGYIIKREEKIYLSQEKERIKNKLAEAPSIGIALVYISISLLTRLEMIKIEKSILELPQDTQEGKSPSKTSMPLSVHKVPTSSHPIRITGQTSQEDIQNMLRQENSYTMTIEQYGERMMKIMEDQGLSLAPSEVASNEPEDADILADLEPAIKKAQEEQERQKKEKDDLCYGDGNRIGRK
ncbi:uncharacterized protein NESG_02454 [Nematocida ausubeli]|uniref:Uncharacterized protein n=1 Tax=Nematocida ausubeli (strain ATCC PRA-371 / ERTm2) TaxID=1913371 RepID=A0A086IZ14_NEMA1|nr:uncharacterized protein NESG_02454 [Nematocida ausubeli]KAI5132266.1 hypothetical protein NEAUS06_0055 [Nematocida ausubeli]KFG25132.1 hypothetical protein NESG_02454 [Nematocida ausubeli]